MQSRYLIQKEKNVIPDLIRDPCILYWMLNQVQHDSKSPLQNSEFLKK